MEPENKPLDLELSPKSPCRVRLAVRGYERDFKVYYKGSFIDFERALWPTTKRYTKDLFVRVYKSEDLSDNPIHIRIESITSYQLV